MHDDAAQLTDRVQRFLAERLRPAIIRDAVPCDLAIYEVAGEPVPVAEALTASLKAMNRRCEHLLREAELWSATALALGLLDYPHDGLERAWKTLLLLQFHDILPGSSIAWVNDEAAAAYDELATSLETIISRATRALAGVPGLGTAPVRAGPGTKPEVRVSRNGIGPNVPGCVVLDNGLLRVVIDPDGLLCSVRDLLADRELIPGDARANLLRLHRDLPNRWDAWDIDAWYRHQVTDLTGRDGTCAPSTPAPRSSSATSATRCTPTRRGTPRVSRSTRTATT